MKQRARGVWVLILAWWTSMLFIWCIRSSSCLWEEPILGAAEGIGRRILEKGVHSLLCFNYFCPFFSLAPLCHGNLHLLTDPGTEQAINFNKHAIRCAQARSSKSFHYSLSGGNQKILEMVLSVQTSRLFFILLTYYWNLQNILWTLVDW